MDTAFSLNDGLGWTGATLVLMAYGLLSMGRLKSEQAAYHLLNLTGSLCLAVYAVNLHATASVVVNVIWLAIAIWALSKPLRTRSNRKP
jgi:hypothetical protein